MTSIAKSHIWQLDGNYNFMHAHDIFMHTTPPPSLSLSPHTHMHIHNINVCALCSLPPGILSTAEYSSSCSTTSNYTQQSPRTNSVPNFQPHDHQQSHKFTDGGRVFTQATDNAIPSLCNRLYMELAIAHPQPSEELTSNRTYTGNHILHAQATDSGGKQALESLQNGCFPSADTYRCQLESHIKKLVYCSQVCAICLSIGMEITEMLICRHSLKQLDLRLVPLSLNHYKSQKGLAREGMERYLDALYIQET